MGRVYDFFRFVKKVSSKPISVILFRLKQSLVLAIMHRFGGWRRITRIAVGTGASSGSRQPTILSACNLTNEDKVLIEELSKNVIDGEFKIFDSQPPPLSSIDFSADWRFGYSWEPKYFKKYNFYETNKGVPYDVKYPWELSRFHYLLPVVISAGVSGEQSDLDWTTNILKEWRKSNPLAYSVNWYPMEASIRAINLVMLMDACLIYVKETPGLNCDGLIRLISTILIEHGEFIWRNIEFTDVRGNHYFANLVSLLVIGYALCGIDDRYKNWSQYAYKKINKEVLFQYLNDGVNFEKASGYHKLVTELLVVAVIASGKQKEPVPILREMLLKAALFSDALTNPYGITSCIGDNDSSSVLPYAGTHPLSHGAIVECARAISKDHVGGEKYSKEEQLSAKLICGSQKKDNSVKVGVKSLHAFKSGGYFVVKKNSLGFHLVMDVGEVGMCGRGGHGHNDILSFELYIRGQPFILDSGSPTYTGDLVKKNHYRSTGMHSTIKLFDMEMARFSGWWGILDDAKPLYGKATEVDGGYVLRGSHTGYARVREGCIVTRDIFIKNTFDAIEIKDTVVNAYSGDAIEWNFPMASKAIEIVGGSRLIVNSNNVLLEMECPVDCDWEECELSQGYGSVFPSGIVRCRTKASRDGDLEFVFRLAVKYEDS